MLFQLCRAVVCASECQLLTGPSRAVEQTQLVQTLTRVFLSDSREARQSLGKRTGDSRLGQRIT
jgi:hypothetical protein